MPGKTSIEWAESSWNPVTGCTQVSAGCDHCYALTFAERWRGVPNHPFEQGFDLKLWPDRLRIPLTWKKPKRIFVNSMSDLFHADVPDEFIFQVWETMRLATQHQFLILTKRPQRMARFARIVTADGTSILPNVWLGTSIENNEVAWRTDFLRRTPAAVRFLSCEPLIGPLPSLDLDGIDWVIAGAESGHGARPMDDDWVRDLRDRCRLNGPAFFFKQRATPSGHKLGLPELDGETWVQFPDDPERIERGQIEMVLR